MYILTFIHIYLHIYTYMHILQGMQSTLTSQLDKIDHHLREEFAARYSILAKELPKSAAGNSTTKLASAHSEKAPEMVSKLLLSGLSYSTTSLLHLH
jgi:hypothetical protein